MKRWRASLALQNLTNVPTLPKLLSSAVIASEVRDARRTSGIEVEVMGDQLEVPVCEQKAS